MDYQETLQQLFAGSESHRKRKLELDKQKTLALQSKDFQKLDTAVQSQLRWITRIREGNNNTLRTLRIKLFILRFVQKRLIAELQQTETLLGEFDAWLNQYALVAAKNSLVEQKKSMLVLDLLLQKLSKLTVVYHQRLKQENDIRWKSCLMQTILMLQLVVALFKKMKPLSYDAMIFSDKNRYNPLNVFFPFRFNK